MTTQLSITTVALLNATKKQDITKEFSYEFLKEVLVEPIGRGLNIRNCLEIAINTLLEMRREPRFEIPYGNNERNDLLFKIIFAPATGPKGLGIPNLSYETTFLHVYESMIVECLNHIRLSRIDWCRDQLSLD